MTSHIHFVSFQIPMVGAFVFNNRFRPYAPKTTQYKLRQYVQIIKLDFMTYLVYAY